MDHPHYRYSALPGRTEALLPPGLHTFVVLHLEHWDFDAPEGALRDPRFVGEFGSFNPDWRSWSQREYGLRIGIYRLIEALAAAGVTPAVAASALVMPRVPELVDALSGAGAEWLGHGLAATRIMHSGLPLEEQQSHVRHSIEALRAATGAAPRGWLSQDWGSTPATFGLLADAGIAYTLDWGNDDQPFWMEPSGASGSRLLALPFSSEWDDVQGQWLRNTEPGAHARAVLAGARRLAGECAREGRSAVMGLGLHPWVWGMPSRIPYLRQLLAEMNSVPGLAWALPGQLAAQCRPPA